MVWLTEWNDYPMRFLVNGRTYADGFACAATYCRGLYPDAEALRIRSQRLLVLESPFPIP